MIYLILILCLISIYEVPRMYNQKQITEIIIYTCMIILTIVSGYLFFSDPLVQTSIVSIIMGIWDAMSL